MSRPSKRTRLLDPSSITLEDVLNETSSESGDDVVNPLSQTSRKDTQETRGSVYRQSMGGNKSKADVLAAELSEDYGSEEDDQLDTFDNLMSRTKRSDDRVSLAKAGKDLRDLGKRDFVDQKERDDFIDEIVNESEDYDDEFESESMSSDDEDKNKQRKRAKEIKAAQIRQANDPKKMTDLMDIVEYNEKQNENVSEKVAEQASQLLSFNKEYYNVKKELILYSQFPHISHKIYELKDHKYFGIVSCVAMYDNYLFVGNSSGIIRVFDVKTSKEMKPLIDDQVDRVKVTCITLTDDGAYLLSGYKKGQLILWDLQKYKMAKIIPDAHQGEVTNCKIFHVTDEGTVNIVSSEDAGKVKFIEVVRKNLFGGYNHHVYNLIDKRLKGTASIAVQRPSDLYPSGFCDHRSLVAFGAVNEVLISSMRPIESLFNLRKPKMIKENKVAYLDWGYGLTPKIRDRTLNILAVAWDNLIQLVYINEQPCKVTVELDGYYLMDHNEEINSIFFMGDSILVALVNQKEVKVLYTPKFQPGGYEFLTNAPTTEAYNSSFQTTLDLMKYAELEKGHQISEIRASIIQSHSVMNFNNTVTKFKKNLLYVGNKQLMRGRLLSWREYLEKLKFTDNQDWLTVLKAALEIYNGDLKGFAKVPDQKDLRQKMLKSYMKDMITDSIKMVIHTTKKDTDVSTDDDSRSYSEESQKYSVDTIAIKVSIEFCLNIGDVDFLYTEIYQLFCDHNLREKFIFHLEPFILSGQFRSFKIPEPIIRKLIRHYETEQKFKLLEKIIQQLDLSDYSMREDLLVLCQHNCMVSALLYLFTSGQPKHDQTNGCMQILNTMYKMMVQTKDNETIQMRKDEMYRQPGVEEIRLLVIVDSQKKYEIEKSYIYIGYKLYWIIQMFLEGKKFPYGNLSDAQWRAHVYDIVYFITTQEYLSELLEFDPVVFFRVVTKLFVGRPWLYLTQQEKYLERVVEPWDILRELETRVMRDRSEGSKTADSFYKFILQILVQQSMELNSWKQEGECIDIDSIPKTMELEYDVCLKAILNALTVKEKVEDPTLEPEAKSYVQVNRTSRQVKSKQEEEKKGQCLCDQLDTKLVMAALKAFQLKIQDVDKLFALLDQHKSDFSTIHIRIKLYENKKDYVEAFKLHFNDPVLKKKIFRWINQSLKDLVELERDFQFEQEQQERQKIERDNPSRDFTGNPGEDNRTKRQQEADLRRALRDSSSEDEFEMPSELGLRRTTTIAKGYKKEDVEEEKGEEKKEKVAAEEFKAYPPLVNLKQSIKLQMKDLAQISCQKTMKLVNTWLNDDDLYQEHLINHELSRFPNIQFEYLSNYVINQEEDIISVVKESIYQPRPELTSKNHKYQLFLILFTRLLCEYDKKEVEYWVNKDYFPVNECLEVCRNMGHSAGEAALVLRSGNYLEAIKIYLKQLEAVDVKTMQDHMATKDSRPQVGSSPEWDVGKVGAFTGGITLFDEVLEKACQVAESKKNNVAVCGEDGFFLILEYLQDYALGARIKCGNAFPEDTQSGYMKRGQVKSYLASARIPFEIKVERLKDFVVKRTNAILHREKLELSLKSIMDRLNLEFLQIQSLYDFKLKKYSEKKRMLDISVKVQKQDLNMLFGLYLQMNSGGFAVEPTESSKYQQNQFYVPRLIESMNVRCARCGNPIYSQDNTQEAYSVFTCGHFFHSHCQDGSKYCLAHGKSYYDLLEESKKLMRSAHPDEDDTEEEEPPTSGLFNDEDTYDSKERSQTLQQKKLQSFDEGLINDTLQTRDYRNTDAVQKTADKMQDKVLAMLEKRGASILNAKRTLPKGEDIRPDNVPSDDI